MIYLIIGTPDSGKSAKAESLVLTISDVGHRYYIATMEPFGEEGKKRVEKHRKMREGKGFETIECPLRVHEIIDGIKDRENATCLLECMSNLIGNEMHTEKGMEMGEAELSDYITDSVKTLADAVKNLVIVTNRFPLEGEGYDDDTRRFVRLVDIVNEKLRRRADEVYELT